jgi:hypothetical protein
VKTIHKYPLSLDVFQTVSVPGKPISVIVQRGTIVVYALVDTDSESLQWEFVMCGTGQPTPENIDGLDFLGTVSLYDGSLILHVFYH